MKRAGIVLGALVSAVALWWPMFIQPEATGWGDWQQFHHWWEIGVVSLRRWGEWPLWDPHHCGGVSHWGQPQAQNFSPLYLITAMPFGTTLGHKLYLLVHHVLGWSGLYVLARRHARVGRAGSFLAATVWTSSGVAVWDGAGGHSTFLAFQLVPWLLCAWREADRDVRYAVAVAALMTEILAEGGTYPLPYSVIVLAFDTVCRLRLATLGPIVRTGLVSVMLTVLLAAYRWVPVYIAMSRHPRPAEDNDAIDFLEVVEMWTSRSHDWTWPGHPWVWAEYGSYIGWGILLLTAIGIAEVVRGDSADGVPRRWLRGPQMPILLGALLFCAFSMGSHDWYWPFPLIAQRLPGIGNLRVPSRWQVVCTMYVALLAGIALTRLERWLASRQYARDLAWAREVGPWLLAIALSADVVGVGLTVAQRWDGPPIGTFPAERPHLIGPSRYLEEYANYPSRNVGTMECYDPVPWVRASTLWVGDVAQAWIVDGQSSSPRPRPPTHRAGDVLHGYDRTNHTAWADVELHTAGRVVFNQNFEPQWHASVGTVVDDEGRLAVDLPPGRHRVVVRFEPDDLPYSLWGSLAGLALSALVVLLAPDPRRLRASARPKRTVSI
jgi:hypothetical protein